MKRIADRFETGDNVDLEELKTLVRQVVFPKWLRELFFEFSNKNYSKIIQNYSSNKKSRLLRSPFVGQIGWLLRIIMYYVLRFILKWIKIKRVRILDEVDRNLFAAATRYFPLRFTLIFWHLFCFYF